MDDQWLFPRSWSQASLGELSWKPRTGRVLLPLWDMVAGRRLLALSKLIGNQSQQSNGFRMLANERGCAQSYRHKMLAFTSELQITTWDWETSQRLTQRVEPPEAAAFANIIPGASLNGLRTQGSGLGTGASSGASLWRPRFGGCWAQRNEAERGFQRLLTGKP